MLTRFDVEIVLIFENLFRHKFMPLIFCTFSFLLPSFKTVAR